MTPDQITLVRASWVALAADADALTTRFYAHLFEIDDSAAKLFAHTDLDAQRAKLAQSLAFVIKVLDDPDRLLPAVGVLGKRHVDYGVEHRHFESVGQALLWSIADSLGSALTDELRNAWAEAYALVASVMRRALIRAEKVEA